MKLFICKEPEGNVLLINSAHDEPDDGLEDETGKLFCSQTYVTTLANKLTNHPP